MQAQDLSLDQLVKLRRSLRPKLHYIRKLKSRMLATQFPAHDRILRDVLITEAALNDLVSEIETCCSYRTNTAQQQRDADFPF